MDRLNTFVENSVFVPVGDVVGWVMDHCLAKRIAIVIFFACAVLVFFPQILYGQEQDATPATIAAVELPDAPIPAMPEEEYSSSSVSFTNGAVLPSPSRKAKETHKAASIEFDAARSALTASLSWDLKTTTDFLEHGTHVKYHGTCYAVNNGVTTSGPCSQYDIRDYTYYFSEVGWGARMLRCNPRSEPCVLFSGVFFATGIQYAANRIFQKGGKWGRRIAITGTVIEAAFHARAAWKNQNNILDRNYVPVGATDITWY
jgi:hypothetical protein